MNHQQLPQWSNFDVFVNAAQLSKEDQLLVGGKNL